MKDSSDSSSARAGRWSRFAWLERLPLLGHFFRHRSKRAPPRPPSPPRFLEQLEERRVFNDPIGTAQTTLWGSTALLLVPTVNQVLAHGWGVGQPDFDPSATSHRDNGAPPETLWASAGDVSFAPLQVGPKKVSGTVELSKICRGINS